MFNFYQYNQKLQKEKPSTASQAAGASADRTSSMMSTIKGSNARMRLMSAGDARSTGAMSPGSNMSVGGAESATSVVRRSN